MNKRAFSILVFLLICCLPVMAQYEEPETDSVAVVEEIPEVQNEEVVIQPSQFKRIDTQFMIGERQVDTQVVTRLKADDDYWYANVEREKKKESKGFTLPELDTIFWILFALVVVGLLVWVLARGEVFRRSSRIDTNEANIEEENIYEIKFEEEIRKAVTAGNYRLAVRLHYLQSLRALADRGLIHYATGKTNGQYLFELAGNPLYKMFFSLTRHFDYTWYGQFPLSLQSYRKLETDFNEFKTKLHS